MAAEKSMATKADIDAAMCMTDSLPEKPARLSMDDVYFFARTAAKVRGFPEAALDDIAYRIVWLERRGLPGLTYFTAELLDNDHLALHERANFSYEPFLKLTCPIFSGTLIRDNFDELISSDESEIRVIRGPSNAFLLLPKLAHYAAERDVPIVVSWTTDECTKVAARTIVYDYKIIQQGALQDMVDADGVGICRFTGSLPDVFRGADQDTAMISPVTMLKLMAYCGRDMKIPKPQTPAESDIEKTIRHDPKLAVLFRALNMQEKALISGFATSRAGTVLTTHPRTRNERFWTHLTAMGWLEPTGPKGIGLKCFTLTPMGRQGIPTMLRVLQSVAA